ncbi:MAG: hypothetical protein IBJ15_04780 [Alphaproteobacteria bacterium]|nr:hypothetical protein [Alphaproteobacteria bacterium]
MRTKLILAAAALMLAGCQSLGLGGGVERPRGTGANTDDLRRSPCACMELPNAAPDETLMRELRALPAARG